MAFKELLNQLKLSFTEKGASLIINSRILTGGLAYLDHFVVSVNRINFVTKKLWLTSWSFQFFEAFRSRLRRFKALTTLYREQLDRRWGAILETILIILIALMPVLNAWGILLVLIILLQLIRLPETKLPDTGLFIFWVALLVSALLAAGSAGIFRLFSITVWLLMAGLAGSTFSPFLARRIIRFTVFTGIFWMIIGFWQQWAGIPTPPGWLEPEQSLLITVRSFAVFGNPNIYGLYLLSIITFSLFEAASATRYRLFFCFTLFLAAVSLAFTYSRTAWFIGMVVFGVRLKDRGFDRKYLSLLGAVLILFLCFPGFKARIESFSNIFDNTLGFRLKIWQNMFRPILENWWFGSGPGSFREIYAFYQSGTGAVQHGHQLYLQLLLENGIFSLLVFLWLVCQNLSGFLKFQNLAKATAVVIVVFMLAGFLETWWVHQFMGGYFWLNFGLLLSLKTGQID